MCEGFVAGAEVVLGEDCHPQPDWFKKSALSFQPLISLQNSLLKRWLHSQCHRDRQRHFVMLLVLLRQQRMIGSSRKREKWKIMSCEMWVHGRVY